MKFYLDTIGYAYGSECVCESVCAKIKAKELNYPTMTIRLSSSSVSLSALMSSSLVMKYLPEARLLSM